MFVLSSHRLREINKSSKQAFISSQTVSMRYSIFLFYFQEEEGMINLLVNRVKNCLII